MKGHDFLWDCIFFRTTRFTFDCLTGFNRCFLLSLWWTEATRDLVVSPWKTCRDSMSSFWNALTTSCENTWWIFPSCNRSIWRPIVSSLKWWDFISEDKSFSKSISAAHSCTWTSAWRPLRMSNSNKWTTSPGVVKDYRNGGMRFNMIIDLTGKMDAVTIVKYLLEDELILNWQLSVYLVICTEKGRSIVRHIEFGFQVLCIISL